MKKYIFGALLGALALPGVAQAACGKVSITEMNWASSAIITKVAEFIMVQGYNCEVTLVPSSTTPSVTSVAENGEPDIVTELWLNSAPLYTKLEAEGKIETAAKVISDGGSENWWIPKYLADKHPELKTIDGILANPKLVGGRFHNCPDGWGCRKANDNLKVAYDLEGNGIEVFNHGSGETLATSMASAYENKEPWFGYYWGPTSLLGSYDMVAVDMGPYVKEIHECNAKSECATPGKSSFPAAPVLTGITTDFAKREPAVADLMRKLSFTNLQMSQLLAWQEENKASAEEAAVHFLTNNADVWSAWLNDSARKNLSALLN